MTTVKSGPDLESHLNRILSIEPPNLKESNLTKIWFLEI